MTEVKERIVDMEFEDTELEDEFDLEEAKQKFYFPKIKPFYVPTLRPINTLWFWSIL